MLFTVEEEFSDATKQMWHREHSCSVYKSLFYHFTRHKVKQNGIQHSLLNTESVRLCYNLQKCFLFDSIAY